MENQVCKLFELTGEAVTKDSGHVSNALGKMKENIKQLLSK